MNVRLFEDDNDSSKRWHRNVKDKSYEILCVSQFTLYSKLKGNKPDFHLAMQGDAAIQLYNILLKKIRDLYGNPEMIKGMDNIYVIAYNLIKFIHS